MLRTCEQLGVEELGFTPRRFPAQPGDLWLELTEWSWRAQDMGPPAVLNVVEDHFFELPGAEGQFAMQLAGLREYPEQFVDAVVEHVAPWADDVGGHVVAATCERARTRVISWTECFGALAVLADDTVLDDRYDLGLVRSFWYVGQDREPDVVDWLKAGIEEARAVARRVELAGPH